MKRAVKLSSHTNFKNYNGFFLIWHDRNSHILLKAKYWHFKSFHLVLAVQMYVSICKLFLKAKWDPRIFLFTTCFARYPMKKDFFVILPKERDG